MSQDVDGVLICHSMRDSMIVYRSFYEAIKDLEITDQGIVWNAIFEYSLNFKEVELSGIPKVIFTLVKPNLQANMKRFENGSKPKQKQVVSKIKAKQKQSRSKREANKDKDVNVDKDNNLNPNKDENAAQTSLQILDSKLPLPFPPKNTLPKTYNEIESYLMTLDFPDQVANQEAQKIFDYYASKGWKVGTAAMKDWQASTRNWMRREIEKHAKSDDRLFGKVTKSGLQRTFDELKAIDDAELERKRIEGN